MKYPIVVSTTEKMDKTESIINVNVPDIKDGFIKTVGAKRFAVLMVIVAHMNNEGQSYPSQRRISELTGQSIPTVNKIVKELSEIEYNGKPVLRKSVKGVHKKLTIYDIDMTGVADESEKEEAESDKPMNSKDVAHYFAKVYEDVYKTPYTINYGRDLALIKQKLIGTYTDEQLKKMVDVAVKYYEKEYSSEKYPRPTISMVCTWLGNQALNKASQLEKKENTYKQSEQMDKTDEAMSLFD